ncbi:hypothetical protein [Alkalicoccobacillus murimartini]|uniref:Uncharacterized protein n=1 Tax=Alkalicoccobacillus murimartini TaxID=171685 RepID=A0ABT9YJH0_9BACI|nr:hypothetical protein [Alkalicoccobacillus murimartini]MDQ0207179.1 hypothetical protein [Alkalicoccobacillus murimartini]
MKEFLLLRLSVFIFLGLLAYIQVNQYLSPISIIVVLFVSSLTYFLIYYHMAKKRIPPS